MVNIPELQRQLDHTTANVERWNQGSWCTTPERTLDEVLESFSLPEQFSQIPSHQLYDSLLPVPDCGSRFCLAGNAAVQNGWVFVNYLNEDIAEYVVRRDQLEGFLLRLLDNQHDRSLVRSPREVGAEILGLTEFEADALFEAYNSLLDLWALAYAITDGGIVLPQALPAYCRDNIDHAEISEVQDEVLATIRGMGAHDYEDNTFGCGYAAHTVCKKFLERHP